MIEFISSTSTFMIPQYLILSFILPLFRAQCIVQRGAYLKMNTYLRVFIPRKTVICHLFWISIEVQIRHDFPWNLPADAATHAEHFPCQHPPHQTNRVCTFVIARDCDIHTFQWRVSVAECNNWNVHIGCFCYRLKKKV